MSAVAIALGTGADLLLGDPRRWHPVAGFGRAAAALERAAYRPSRRAGARPRRRTRRRRDRRGRRRRARGERMAARRAARRLPVDGARRALARRARRSRSPPASRPATSPPGGGASPRSSAATPRRSTGPSCARPRSSRWPRTPSTPSSRRCSGRRSRARPARSATARSTRSTRWSATAATATRASAPRRPRADDVANWPAARIGAGLTVLLAPLVGGDPGAAARAWRRDAPAPSEPERGRRGGGVRGRARRPARRDARLRRARRAPPGCSATAARRARPTSSARCGSPARVVRRGAADRRCVGRPAMKGAAAGRGHRVGRRQERRDRGALPLAPPPGRLGGAVQGAEHGAQLRGHADGRGDRPRAGAAGRRGRRIEPEAAMNPVLIKPAGRAPQPGAADGQPVRGRRRALATRSSSRRCARPVARGARGPARPLRRRRSARAPAARRRSTCAPPTSPTSGSRARPTCRCWWSATSTAAGCSPRCTATLALLEPADQAHVAGFLINKFRGDHAILAPGLEQLRALTGRPTLGVLPWLDGLWLDVEDSLALEAPRRRGAPRPRAATRSRSRCVRLRWMSNFTDVDALAAEPGVERALHALACRRRARRPRVRARVPRPPSRTSSGCAQSGLDRGARSAAPAAATRSSACAAATRCSESGSTTRSRAARGRVDGPRPAAGETTFAREKLLRHAAGHGAAGRRARRRAGYEIRHGHPARHGGEPLIDDGTAAGEGCVAGAVLGTSWHGLLEGDELRRALLAWVRRRRGRRWVPGTAPFAGGARAPPRPPRRPGRRARRHRRPARPDRGRRAGRAARRRGRAAQAAAGEET